MNNFHPFVIPFATGFVFVIAWLIFKVFCIWKSMPISDKRNIRHNILSVNTIYAIGEIVTEVLLHRRIWRKNRLLGFMHFSFAFGWFMLIVTGKFESLIYTGKGVNHVWYPLFFKFFEPGEHQFAFSNLFTQAMDLWLALILAGQLVAFLKRKFPQKAGVTIRTKHTMRNRIALTALWFIFPLRLAAESVTAGLYGGGGFLTGSIGSLLHETATLESLFMPLWWAYSTALFMFFVMIPYSRYLHIPIEAFLILARNWKVKDEKTLNRLETMACSACGMCLGVCPLAQANIAPIQPVYYIERLRAGRSTQRDKWSCLQCKRCEDICPVQVQSTRIRQEQKAQPILAQEPNLETNHRSFDKSQKVNVVLFSGCMGKLTPRTKVAMDKIMRATDLKYKWVDEEKDLCCGRPLTLNGQHREATAKLNELADEILSYSPQMIVTTCPICYNRIKDKFSEIPVMHHTTFIQRMMDNGRIELTRTAETMTYHDPCELSRIANVIDEPLSVLKNIGTLKQPTDNGKESHCCGGALAGIYISSEERTKLTQCAAQYLQQCGAKNIVTACPLCKKSIAQHTSTTVIDFAEIVAKALVHNDNTLTPQENFFETKTYIKNRV